MLTGTARELVTDFESALGGAMVFAGAAIEQSQVVLDFGHRAHGGTRVMAGGFLVDRNGRGEALDRIHIGHVHLG
jgi:hypothetical protein